MLWDAHIPETGRKTTFGWTHTHSIHLVHHIWDVWRTLPQQVQGWLTQKPCSQNITHLLARQEFIRAKSGFDLHSTHVCVFGSDIERHGLNVFFIKGFCWRVTSQPFKTFYSSILQQVLHQVYNKYYINSLGKCFDKRSVVCACVLWIVQFFFNSTVFRQNKSWQMYIFWYIYIIYVV